MKVLVACEESQTVCIAFRNLGHEAYSCDLQECSGNHPEWHIQTDALNILNDNWDLIIAHPPCTYLSNAGARWLYKNGHINIERYEKGLKAKEFFLKILNAECERIAIENPMPSKIYDLPKCSQIIQPFEFGDPYSKKTYLWLKGLPPLFATGIYMKYKPFIYSGSYKKDHDKFYMGVAKTAKERSKTFKGIAAAMADQWGG